jgi:hypothetical protein
VSIGPTRWEDNGDGTLTVYAETARRNTVNVVIPYTLLGTDTMTLMLRAAATKSDRIHDGLNQVQQAEQGGS